MLHEYLLNEHTTIYMNEWVHQFRRLREMEVFGLVDSVTFRQRDLLVPSHRLRRAQGSIWGVCNKGHWHFVTPLDICLACWFAKLIYYLNRGKENHQEMQSQE